VHRDVVIVGGGLAGSLAAWRITETCRDLRVCLVEAGPRLGGNHTWSFHDTDVSTDARAWLEPLVVARWPRHEVRFPGSRRLLAGGYASVTSERLHDVIAPVLGAELRTGIPVSTVAETSVTLETGERIPAGLVIDARGASRTPLPLGWQTFVGREFELVQDHGLEWPLLMDATVPQCGGFRFIYVLPWSRRRLLVEDTLYADGPAIDLPACRQAIDDYVTRQDWVVSTLIREEVGTLPIPLGGRNDVFWPDNAVRIGVRAGLFHPTTGYSLPDAVATADLLASLDLRDRNCVYRSVREFARRTWRARGFFRLLNRLLFRAAEPDQRYRVLRQFYERPDALIARFYAGRLTWLDRCLVLAGRPPVPLSRALAALRVRE
jgi:lycopene beta-cyclase